MPAGTHTYTIEAYKGTGQLVSPKTSPQTVHVGADLKAPEPPVNFTIKLIADGVELKWQDSPTADVVKYVVSFGTSENNMELVKDFPKELERMVDRLIRLGEGNKKFLNEIAKPIDILQNILQDTSKLDQKHAMEFAKAVSLIKKADIKDVKSNDMVRMRQNLITISEVIMDWMVTLKIEN